MAPNVDVTQAKLDRLVWAVLFVLSAGTLLVARALTPSSDGFGTHEQLGLPPCAFYAWFDIPCPACGLTTSFAHLARLDLTSALRVQPMGVPLFLITAACVVLSAFGLWRGMSVTKVIDRFELDRWALGVAIALLVAWGARLVGLVLT